MVILFITVLLSSCGGESMKQGSAKLSSVEFYERIKDAEDAQIVDVRTPEEFKNGHLENAFNLNWDGADFEAQLATLDKSKTVFVYCLSGSRSHSAAEKMREQGFEKIIEMPGGMLEWRMQSLPEAKLTSMEKGMDLEQYHALINSDKLVLVDFYADWCAPCKKMEPYLNQIAAEMPDKVTLVRIDVDKNTELAKELGITALPFLKLYNADDMVWENLGFITEEDLRKQFLNYEK